MNVLVVCEHANGRVADITRELLSAGRELGSLTLVVIASQPEQLLSDRSVSGVEEIICARVSSDDFDPDVYKRTVGSIIQDRKPDVALLGHTINSICYGPAVAARLGLGFASDVHALRVIDGRLIATRSMFGSRVWADVEFPDASCSLLMLRSRVWRPSELTGDPSISEMAVPPFPSRLRHLGFIEREDESGAEIESAALLLSIGRGAGDAEGVARFQRLADRLGVPLVSSRPLVDAGLMPASRQVGQSGKTVKPKIYLAFGISGAIQHLAGIRDAESVIAINKDPEAPIFEIADIGAVADAFDVADELESFL